jgi:AraC-like DNA-binding protein
MPGTNQNPDELGTAGVCGSMSSAVMATAAADVPGTAAPRRAGGLPTVRLRGVLAFIEAHIADDIRLGELAALARLSTDHFAAQFRQSTGWSPHRYVVQRRIERSKALLASSVLPLAQIGYALGFASQAHFTTTFHKLVGVTPGAYRRRYSRLGNQSVAGFCKSSLNSEILDAVLTARHDIGDPRAQPQALAAT